MTGKRSKGGRNSKSSKDSKKVLRAYFAFTINCSIVNLEFQNETRFAPLRLKLWGRGWGMGVKKIGLNND